MEKLIEFIFKSEIDIEIANYIGDYEKVKKINEKLYKKLIKHKPKDYIKQ